MHEPLMIRQHEQFLRQYKVTMGMYKYAYGNPSPRDKYGEYIANIQVIINLYKITHKQIK